MAVICGQHLPIQMLDHPTDLIMLLQDAQNSSLDTLISLHQHQLVLKDSRPEITDILDLLLQVHQLKRTHTLNIPYRLSQPK